MEELTEDDLNFAVGPHPKCLICYSKIERTEADDPSIGNQLKSSALTAQLRVIFILKHALDLPSPKLVNYLKKNGNPEHWFQLCDTCNQEVDHIKQIFNQLAKIKVKYSEIKEKLKDKIKNSSSAHAGVRGGDYKTSEIVLDCRRFVCRGKKVSSLENERNAIYLWDELAVKFAQELKGRVPESHKETEHKGTTCSDEVNFAPNVGNANEGIIRSSETDGPSSPSPSVNEDMQSNFSSLSDGSGPSNSKASPVKKTEEVKTEAGFLCPNCPGKVFKVKSYLRRHIKRGCRPKRQPPTLNCNICGITRSDGNVLKFHQAKVHNIDIDNFHCSICDKWFQRSWDKRKHVCFQPLKLENVDSPCPRCGKVYPNRKALTQHIYFSHDKRHYKACELCGKSVTTRRYNRHLSSIHNIGDFKCPEESCTKVFSKQCYLDDHVNFDHKGQTTYVCEICGKGVKSDRCLDIHMRVMHAPDRDLNLYKCDVCEKSFATKKYLRYHIKGMHGGGIRRRKQIVQ